MGTKNPFKENQQFFSSNLNNFGKQHDMQYFNLNLNQTQKYSDESFSVQFKSKSNNERQFGNDR